MQCSAGTLTYKASSSGAGNAVALAQSTGLPEGKLLLHCVSCYAQPVFPCVPAFSDAMALLVWRVIVKLAAAWWGIRTRDSADVAQYVGVPGVI